MPPPPIPPAAKADLTPTGKLRAGINFQNVLLTTQGPSGEQGGVAVKASGLIAKWIENSGVKGLSVAPPAGK